MSAEKEITSILLVTASTSRCFVCGERPRVVNKYCSVCFLEAYARQRSERVAAREGYLQ